MINNYERLRVNVSRLLDYNYPEELTKWESPVDYCIDTGLSRLNTFLIGKCYYINDGLIQRLFLLELLRKPIFSFIPIAFLSTSEMNKQNMNEAIASAMMDVYSEEDQLYDGLSSHAIKSKKLHCRRFCELEDELRELSLKGYRIVVISKFEELSYLDAESKDKGYINISDALKKIANELGMIILIAYQNRKKEMEDSTVLSIFAKPRKYLLPREIIVECNSVIADCFLFSCSKKMITERIGYFRFEKS